MFNLFTKKTKTVPDDSHAIYIGSKSQALRLEPDFDPELDTKVTEYVALIKTRLRNWMTHDIAVASRVNIAPKDTLSARLADLDLKQLPFSGNYAQFISYITPSEIHDPLTRLIDVITRVCMEVPTSVITCLQARFLYSMLYMLPMYRPDAYGMTEVTDPDDLPRYPTKQQWVDLLVEHPWVIFIPFIQDLYEHDTTIAEINKLKAIHQAKDTEVIRTSRSSLASRG